MKSQNRSNQVIDVLMLAELLLESFVLRSTERRYDGPIAHSLGNRRLYKTKDAGRYFFSIENDNITRMKRILRTNYNIERSVITRSLVIRSLRWISLKPTRPWESFRKISVPHTNLRRTIAATLKVILFFSIMCLEEMFTTRLGQSSHRFLLFSFHFCRQRILYSFCKCFCAAFIFDF